MSKALGIVLELDASGAVVNARSLAKVLGEVQGAAQGAGTALGGAARSADFNQGLYNMQQGLQGVGRGLGAASAGIGSFLADAGEAFMGFETGMSRVAIVMGKTGERANLPGLVEDYEMVQDAVVRIGRDTEFSMAQASEAFVNLKQAGLTAAEGVGVMDQVMAFSSATAGTVDLAGAADTATLSISALGTSALDINKTMDMLVKTTTLGKLEAHEFAQAFRSMGPSVQMMNKTKPEGFLAVLTALKQMGQTSAVAGQTVQGFGRTFAELQQVFSGMGTAKGKRKLKFLANLGISHEDLVDADGNVRDLIEIIDTINKKVNKARADGMGSADIIMNLQKGLGNQQARNLFMLTDGYEKYLAQSGQTFKNLGELEKEIGAANGEARDAQAAFLGTMEGKLQVLSGSIDLLKVTVFSTIKDAVKPFIDSVIEITNATTGWIKENPELAKTLARLTVGAMLFLGVLGSLFTMAGLMAGAMAIMNPLIAASGGSFTIAAAGAQFFKQVMKPMVASMLPAIGVMLQVAAVAGLVYVAYQENIGGLRDFVDGWASDLKTLASVIFPLLSGEGIDASTWNGLSERTQNLAIYIVSLKNRLVDFAQGFWEGFWPVLGVWLKGFGFLIKVTLALVNVVGSLLGFTAELTLTGKASIATWNTIGQVIGWVTAMWVGYKIAVTAAMVAQKAALAVAWAVRGALVAKRIAMLAYTNAVGIVRLAQLAWIGVQWALNASLYGCPLVWFVAAVIAAVAALVLVIGYYEEADAAIQKWTGGMFGFIEVLMVLGGPLLWAIGLYQELTRENSRFRDKLVEAWTTIKTFFSGIGAFFLAVGTVIVDSLYYATIAPIMTLYNAGANLMTAIWEGMKSAWDGLVGWFDDKIDYLTGFLPNSPAKHGPLAQKPPEQLGGNVVRMMAQGMDAASGLLPATMENTLNRTVNVSPLQQLSPGLAAFTSQLLGGSANVDQEAAVARLSPPGTTARPGLAEAIGRSQGGAQAPEAAPQPQAQEKPAIHVEANVTFGDIKLNADGLTGAEARKFSRWIASQLGDVIEDELRKRNIA